MEQLTPLKEVAKTIGVSYKTLYSWVCNGEVAYTNTKSGNRYYMSQEQINALFFVRNIYKLKFY